MPAYLSCVTEKPKQLSKPQSQLRDTNSVDEGGGTGGTGVGTTGSGGGSFSEATPKRTESVSEDVVSQGLPAPDGTPEEVASDSSDSDDDEDGDEDNEEARRKRQFRTEKVFISYNFVFP